MSNTYQSDGRTATLASQTAASSCRQQEKKRRRLRSVRMRVIPGSQLRAYSPYSQTGWLLERTSKTEGLLRTQHNYLCKAARPGFLHPAITVTQLLSAFMSCRYAPPRYNF